MGSADLSIEALNGTHVFMVSFPGQGHLNPLLRLGKRLASSGLYVTVSAPEFVGQSIRKSNQITDDEPIQLGRGKIRFEFFDDGWALDDTNSDNLDAYLAQLELVGRVKLPEMIRQQPEKGRPPVSCLINNPFIPWVSDVAENLGIPSAMLWVQSAACFSAYYHFYHKLVPFPTESEPEIDVELPFMPLMKYDEVPSYLHPHTPYDFLKRAILGQYKNLSSPFCILMDTFQELEHEIVQHMSKICRPIKTIGPLFKELKSSRSESTPAPNTKTFRADLFAADDCIGWLDSKPPGSVVYISFGSVVYWQQEQIDELAHGVFDSGLSFLWVLRPPPKEREKLLKPHVLPPELVEAAEKGKGKIVKWSPQAGVLAHPSTACFVTHCGWNSTMEAVTSGVPVVALPFWGDQVTNAKFLVDVYGVGVRLGRGEDEGRVVSREEVAAALTAVVEGPKAADIKKNSLNWKNVAEAAVTDGGSSYNNMQDFVEEIVGLRGEISSIISL